MIKYGSRVKVISSDYCCADLGETGTIVDDGYYSSIAKQCRYLVRWDSNPTMLWGVHSNCIEEI